MFFRVKVVFIAASFFDTDVLFLSFALHRSSGGSFHKWYNCTI